MDTPTVNTELEQALYKASAQERKSRNRALLAIIVPVLAACFWLAYSVFEVTRWQTRSRTIEKGEAALQQRESAANAKAAEAEAQRAAAEANAKTARDEEARAKNQMAENRKGLLKMRSEIASLEVVLNDLTGARSRASLLGNSGALESQILDIRNTLGRGFASFEQHLDAALPDVERKPRVYLFVSDEEQKETAKQLKTALEAAGFDVPAIAKQSIKKLDAPEVRYFRNAKDKAEAAQVAELVRKQLGLREPRVSFIDDADNAGGGGRRYQLWLSKAAAVPK